MSDLALLNRLHDIQAPAAPGWWPPAPGWWLLLLGALVLPALLRRLWRLWQRHRHRRQVLAELELLIRRSDLNDARFAAALSILLKQVTLMHHDRTAVAALHDMDWLRFLDTTGHCEDFTRGPGQVLASAPYQADARVDRPALAALARNWLQRNL